MFSIISIRDSNLRDRRVLSSGYPSALAAGRARVVSGDLVVDATGNVVRSALWLFPWERADPTCFAQRMRGAVS
jgi:hypothetical protein